MFSAPEGSPRERRRRPPAAAVATVLLMLLPGLAAGMSLGAAPASAAGAAPAAQLADGNVVTPGDFTGYGFDQCQAPDQRAMNTLAHALAVPGGRHLHLRQLPRLPQPAQPHARVDQHPAGQGLAAAADHARPAGVVPAALPPLRRRPQDQPPARHRRPVPARPRPGHGRGDEDGRRRQGAGHRAGQHALVRPRGLRRQPHRLPRVGAGLPVGVDRPAAPPRLRLRRLLQRRLGHQDARRRAGRAARTVHAARPDLDRPLGPAGQHLDVLHPRGRLAAGRPDEAVPGRSRRDLGRRPINIDRNYLDLGQGSVAARETHCGGTAISYWRYRRARPRHRRPSTVSALQCLLKEKGVYDGQLTGVVQRRPTVAAATRG